ncbi:MAG: hypothetical protein AAF513_04775 [Pseudomonadota bacterium]
MSRPTILMLHGAGAKPAAVELEALWFDALSAGLERDTKHAKRLADVNTSLFYYADHSTPAEPAQAALDLDDRHACLADLKSRRKAREFRRRYYDELPGKTPVGEFVADVSSALGLGKTFLRRRVPDLMRYLEDETFAGSLRASLEAWLTPHLQQQAPLLIVSHCMGAVLAFEALCSAQQGPACEVSLLTMGAPLASNVVKSSLSARSSVTPAGLTHWYNVAAEDDYVCHDKSVADDYKVLLDDKRVAHIEDFTIYNLALRFEKSNPHHASGYLIHPRVAQLVGDWLKAAT